MYVSSSPFYRYGRWGSSDLSNLPKITHLVRVWADSITWLFSRSHSWLQKLANQKSEVNKSKCPTLGAWIGIISFVGNKFTMLIAAECKNEHWFSSRLKKAYPVDYNDRICADLWWWPGIDWWLPKQEWEIFHPALAPEGRSNLDSA